MNQLSIVCILLLLLAITALASAEQQQQSAALARIEKSLNTNPKSASMWLNAGATLMKESSSAGTDANILINNKRYNSEAALVKAIELDPKQGSAAWHYLASVLTQQSLDRLEKEQQEKLNSKHNNNNNKDFTNLIAKAKVGDRYYTAVEAVEQSVIADPKSEKSWTGASHLLRELIPFFDQTNSDNSNGDDDSLFAPTVAVAGEIYDTVLCAQKALRTDAQSPTTWAYAGKALLAAEQYGKHQHEHSSSADIATDDVVAGEQDDDDKGDAALDPEQRAKDKKRKELLKNNKDRPLSKAFIVIDQAGTRADGINCMEQSLAMYSHDINSWNILCAQLAPDEEIRIKNKSDKKNKQQQEEDGDDDSNKNNNNYAQQTKKKKVARIEEEVVDRRACLERAVSQDAENSQAWLSLGRFLVAEATTTPEALASASTSSLSASSSAEFKMPTAKVGGGNQQNELTAVQCLETGLNKSPPGVHFASTIQAAWLDACVIMTLGGSQYSMQIQEQQQDQQQQVVVDALQCWEVLLGPGSSTAGSLPGTAGTVPKPNAKSPGLWFALGAALARAERSLSSSNTRIDNIFIGGESYDAARALARAVELDPKRTAIWIALARVLSAREFSASNRVGKTQQLATKVKIRTQQLSALDCFARAVEIAPFKISSWESLCHELVQRDKIAVKQRASVSLVLPIVIGGNQVREQQQKTTTPPQPSRIEQQMCFLELFRRDPDNIYAWTTFRLISDGAAIQVPGEQQQKNKNNNKITTNIDFRIAAVQRFPNLSVMWLQLGRELVATRKPVAILNETTHISVEKCFQRAVELDPESSDAWLFFSSVLAAGEQVNVTLSNLRPTGTSIRRRQVDRVKAALTAIRLDRNSGAAWQHLGSFLAEPILYDKNNDASIESAKIAVPDSADDEAEEDSDSSNSNSGGGGEVVTAKQALVRAVTLDETLFGAWMTLASVLGKIEREINGDTAYSIADANYQQARVEVAGRSVGIAECLAKAIEVTDEGGVRRQPKSVVIPLYQHLLQILKQSNRHVQIRGRVMIATDIEKRLGELRSSTVAAGQQQQQQQM